MLEPEQILDMALDTIKKILYPEEWISLDLAFSKSELFTLFLVDRHGEIIMSQIAEYINASMSTANGIVERLVKNGYLQRDRSDTDRRIVLIRPTPQGKKVVAQLKGTILEYIRLLDASLDEEERRLILKILAKVGDILAQQKAPPYGAADGSTPLKNIPIE